MNDDDLLSKYGLSSQSDDAKTSPDDSKLLSKYGLDAQETKPAIDKTSDWWKGQHDSDYEAVAKRFGIGFLRGAKDVLDTGAHGLANSTAYIADKILPKDLADQVRQSANSTIASDKSARNEFDTEYPASDGIIPNATDVGRFAGQAAGVAPLMPTSAMAGIAGAAGALPVAGRAVAPLVNRLVSAAGQGALGGAVFGGATSSANDKSVAENVGENAIGGALAGPALTAGGALAKNVGSKFVGKISPERAELARKAADHGIDLEAGQVSTSPIFKKFNQVSGWAPFSGAKATSDKQIKQFNTAVAKTFGEDTPNITPTVLQNAKTRIGQDYDTVAKSTDITADNTLINNFSKIYQDAQQALDDNQFKTFQKQLDLIGSKFRQGNGNMDGEAWQSMRHINSPISKVAGGRDTDLGYYVKALKVAMDGAFNRSAPDDMQALLKRANGQYKSMKTVEKLANSDAEGQVSPLKLMQKVVNSPGGKLRSGDLGDLADIGRSFFPQPADSGTPLGEAILGKLGPAVSHPITAAATAIGSLASGAPLLSLAEGGVGLGANAVLRRSINSKRMTNAMLNAAEGKSTNGPLQITINKSVPYSSGLIEDRQKKDRRSRLPVALTE